MPRGDRTGPTGMGARTGRGAGYCGGYGMPGYANPGQGAGYGMGFGRGRGFGGRGWRFGFFATGLPGWMRPVGHSAARAYSTRSAPLDPEAEKRALESHAGVLEEDLALVRKRLSEIEGEKTTE